MSDYADIDSPASHQWEFDSDNDIASLSDNTYDVASSTNDLMSEAGSDLSIHSNINYPRFGIDIEMSGSDSDATIYENLSDDSNSLPPFSDESLATEPHSPASEASINEIFDIPDEDAVDGEEHQPDISDVVEITISPTRIVPEELNQDVVVQDPVMPSVSGEQSKASPSGSRKRPLESDDDDEDGQTCMICMDVWSNSGLHRLASLKCGHLFGHSCIVRWLQLARSKKNMRCPQCNKPASMQDVRYLYAKKLIALDTVERDEIKKRLESVECERNKLELDLKKSQLTTQLQDQMLADLRAKLADAESAQIRGINNIHRPEAAANNTAKGDVNLIPLHTVEICKEGGCRVLAFKESLSLVVVSQRSANTLFSGYGISKMNSLTFRPTQFVFLHTKPIRDLAFHNSDSELLLSVSLDRCAKLLDITSNNVIQSFATPNPLWCCSWDVNDSNKFFVGSQNGIVIQYDMRQTRGPCNTILSDVTPVTSVVTLPSKPGGVLPRGGFLACHLNSCRVYDCSANGEFKGTQLPLDGPFTGMRYDRSTDHFLVSSRPSARSIRGKHIVCELDFMPDKTSLTCNIIQTLNGSTQQNMLSRPCQMKIPGYGSVVASHQESSSTIAIWNVANGAKVCNLTVREPILDICPITVNQIQYLGTVSEKTFRVYRVET